MVDDALVAVPSFRVTFAARATPVPRQCCAHCVLYGNRRLRSTAREKAALYDRSGLRPWANTPCVSACWVKLASLMTK